MKVFNRNTVKYFTYHWFWGLQYHEVEQPDNLLSHVHARPNDDAVIDAMIEKQVRIDGYTLFFKFFYWLFNVHAYASDFYKLAAWFVCGLDEGDEKMGVVQKYVKDPILQLGRGVNEVWKSLSGPFRKNAVPEMQEVHEEHEMHEIHAVHVTVIKVCERMQADLRVLGVDVVNGSTMPWHDIIRAYHKKALSTHPDKVGGNTEPFNTIKAAFDRLQEEVFSDPGNIVQGPIVPMYTEEIATLRAEIERIEVRVTALMEKIQLISAQNQEVQEVFDRTDVSLVETRRFMVTYQQNWEKNCLEFIRNNSRPVQPIFIPKELNSLVFFIPPVDSSQETTKEPLLLIKWH